MDAASEAPEKGASVRVFPDGAGIPAPCLEGGSNAGRQTSNPISLPIAVEPIEQQPAGNSNHISPLPKGKELLLDGTPAGAGAGSESENVSLFFEGQDRSQSRDDQDIENLGKVCDAQATAGRDVEAGPLYPTCDDNDDDSVCRICHMNSGTAEILNLGCACKLDLGQAHKRCAETWFATRGNRECEICGEIAANVKPPELTQRSLVTNPADTVVVVNVHYVRAFARWVGMRLLMICLVWVAVVIIIYRFLVPSIRSAIKRATSS